jgi:hypothetical protein
MGTLMGAPHILLLYKRTHLTFADMDLSSSLGAVNAMHDAVVLANCIYNMTDSTSEGITAAFKEYYDQRHPRLDAQIKRSQSLSALMGGEVTTKTTGMST